MKMMIMMNIINIFLHENYDYDELSILSYGNDDYDEQPSIL